VAAEEEGGQVVRNGNDSDGDAVARPESGENTEDVDRLEKGDDEMEDDGWRGAEEEKEEKEEKKEEE